MGDGQLVVGLGPQVGIWPQPILPQGPCPCSPEFILLLIDYLPFDENFLLAYSTIEITTSSLV